MTRREVLAGLTGSAIWLSGCAGLFPNKFRFRMTVEVETPQGLRTGSSVLEVRASETTTLEYHRTMTLHGEAVAMDLPGGRSLFALMRTSGPNPDIDLAMAAMALLDPAYHNDWVESVKRLAKRQGVRTSAIIPPTELQSYYNQGEEKQRVISNYPLLVTFQDVRDPTSVALVDPANLAATFGPDVALRRMTVALTDESVTKGIEKRLGWLRQYYCCMLDGSRINNSQALANNLTPGSFSTEIRP
jgi:hypothetical protein